MDIGSSSLSFFLGQCGNLFVSRKVCVQSSFQTSKIQNLNYNQEAVGDPHNIRATIALEEPSFERMFLFV